MPETEPKIDKNEPSLKVLIDKEDTLEIEFENEDISYLYALREYVVAQKNIESCAVKKEHPEIGNPKMLIQGKNPKEALKKALKDLLKSTDSLLQKVK